MHDMRNSGKVPLPCFWCRCSRAARVWGHRSDMDGTYQKYTLHGPQFNYEPFNSNSINIRFWSWNYRGCWHQTCPPIVTRYWMGLNIPH
ncbi:unnamed protein product [Phytomonas sp. Hart1]|nr:unnamed protein product [Phytomonas sp. Hart1]|eukprot:CCW72292.1 unnamed protein product [Phytomonas sp. isolate Hart1]